MGTGGFNNNVSRGTGPLGTGPLPPLPARPGTGRLDPSVAPPPAPTQPTTPAPAGDQARVGTQPGLRAANPTDVDLAGLQIPGDEPPAPPTGALIAENQQRQQQLRALERQRAIALLSTNMTIDALKQDPAQGRLLATLANDADPAIRQRFEAMAQNLAKQTFTSAFTAAAQGKTAPQVTADALRDLRQLGEATGLGTTLARVQTCLLYTSPSPRDRTRSRMPSSA